jgi:hypothetical protein
MKPLMVFNHRHRITDPGLGRRALRPPFPVQTRQTVVERILSVPAQIHKLALKKLLLATLCIGLCTPPVGACLFIGCGVGKTSISDITRPMLPFFGAMGVALLMITYIPAITMWLPTMLKLVNLDYGEFIALRAVQAPECTGHFSEDTQAVLSGIRMSYRQVTRYFQLTSAGPPNFSTQFKKHTGQTPSECRRNRSKKNRTAHA